MAVHLFIQFFPFFPFLWVSDIPRQPLTPYVADLELTILLPKCSDYKLVPPHSSPVTVMLRTEKRNWEFVLCAHQASSLPTQLLPSPLIRVCNFDKLPGYYVMSATGETGWECPRNSIFYLCNHHINLKLSPNGRRQNPRVASVITHYTEPTVQSHQNENSLERKSLKSHQLLTPLPGAPRLTKFNSVRWVPTMYELQKLNFYLHP